MTVHPSSLSFLASGLEAIEDEEPLPLLAPLIPYFSLILSLSWSLSALFRVRIMTSHVLIAGTLVKADTAPCISDISPSLSLLFLPPELLLALHTVFGYIWLHYVSYPSLTLLLQSAFLCGAGRPFVIGPKDVLGNRVCLRLKGLFCQKIHIGGLLYHWVVHEL